MLKETLSTSAGSRNDSHPSPPSTPDWRARFCRAMWAMLLCAFLPVVARGEDVLNFEVVKAAEFVQPGAAPVAAPNAPFDLEVTVDPLGYPTFYFYDISSPVITLPAGPQEALTQNAESFSGVLATNFVYVQGAATQTALDSATGSGDYTLDYTGTIDGPSSIVLPLGTDAFPPAPAVSNLVAAQSINNASNFTLQFGGWAQTTTNDYVVLTVMDASSNVVFSTPDIFAVYPEVPLAATNTSIVLTNGTLGANQSYTAMLTYTELTTNDFSGVPLVAAGFSSRTTFTLNTGSTLITNTPAAGPPVSLTNSVLAFFIATGSGPFAGSGAYDLITDVSGTNASLLGSAGGGFSAGGYAYVVTATNTATVTFNDPRLGVVTVQLVFNGAGSGTFALSSAGGMQTGSFVLGAAYAVAASPWLFLPGTTNNQFHTYISGSPGATYDVDVSSNLVNWSSLTTMTIPNLTSNLADGLANPRRYYRARLLSVAYAPTNLTGQTLSCSVSAGASPFATNGVFEWVASAAGTNYQILAGNGATNGAGGYTYALTGANTANVGYRDSGGGATANMQLFFTSVGAGYFYTTNLTGGGYQTGSFTMNAGPSLFFGNAHFTADTSRGRSVSFPADGTAVSLTVTDALGYAWSLSVPGDALLSPTMLTMTPATTVQTNQLVLPISSGVQLGPEGTRFCDGVTLTVTAPATPGSHACLMMGDGSGAGLYLVALTNKVNSYSTTLFHFSSGWVSDPSDAQWQDFVNKNLPQALAAYAQASSQVTALKRVVTQPPVPPDYEFNCSGNNPGGDAASAAYAQALFANESAAIVNLLGAARDLVLLTGDESYGNNAISLSAQLLETSGFRKVNALMSNYGSNPLKFTAVALAALNIDRQDQLLGGPGLPSLLSQLASWAGGNVLNYYWNKLIGQHDYTMAPVLIAIERQVALLGGSYNDTTFLQNVAYGYSFDVTMTCTVTEGSALAIKAQGTVTLPGDPAQPSTVGRTPDGGIVTGSNFNYAYGTDGSCTLQLPVTFSEGGYFNLGCNDSIISFYLDTAMGSTQEPWSCPSNGSAPANLLALLFSTAFMDYVTPKGSAAAYVFPVPWQNLQAQAANTTFSSSSGLPVTFNITIQHNPKNAPKTLSP